MRIAFISTMAGSPWGGSEGLWCQAAMQLLGHGHAVVASVAQWPDVPAPLLELKRAGAVLERRKRRVSLLERGWNRLQRVCLGGSGEDRHWRRILSFRPELVCISQGANLCGVDWMLRCLRAGIPYVSICQANYEAWWPDDDLARRAREAYQGCLHAAFVSGRNRELLETQIGQALPNAAVVRNPFNVPYDSDPPWPSDGEGLRLACVGRLEPKSKGQDLILDVLAGDIWRKRRVSVSLFGTGPCADTLQRQIVRRGLESMVVIAGHVADVSGIWRDHHALLLPSRCEGLPLALVEAMLCGRFGIVTDVAGNVEVVSDNETGFVAASATVKHLDEAMQRAWLRRAEWRTIGRRASASIRGLVPQDPVADYVATLLSLMETRKGRLA